MIRYFIIKIILLQLLFLIQLESKEIDQVIFTIEKNIYTTIDFENRKKYLYLLKKQLFEENEIFEDFVSIHIFNEFAKKNNVNFDEKIIDDYYEKVKQINETILIDEDIIKKNIKYDYQRKIILEKLVSNKLSNEKIKNEVKIFDLYNITIKYFIIDLKYDNEINKIINNLNYNNIIKIKESLTKHKINYEFYDKEIENIETLDPKIKKEILNNKNYFLFKNEFIIIGLIEKSIKENLQLKYTLYQISNTTHQKINTKKIECNKINELDLDENLVIEKYDKLDISKINENIKNELNFINDKIKLINKDKETVIILCKIDYDTDILQNEIFNNKINYLAKKIESDFIIQKKIDYNFKLYE